LSLCAYQPASYKLANDCQLPVMPNLEGNLGNRLTALPSFVLNIPWLFLAMLKLTILTMTHSSHAETDHYANPALGLMGFMP
jgi:hypothetical protein